jgi:hypothetical protein
LTRLACWGADEAPAEGLVAPVAAPEMMDDAVTGSKKGSNSTLQKRVQWFAVVG